MLMVYALSLFLYFFVSNKFTTSIGIWFVRKHNEVTNENTKLNLCIAVGKISIAIHLRYRDADWLQTKIWIVGTWIMGKKARKGVCGAADDEEEKLFESSFALFAIANNNYYNWCSSSSFKHSKNIIIIIQTNNFGFAVTFSFVFVEFRYAYTLCHDFRVLWLKLGKW